MGQDIQYNNVNINITGRATASCVSVLRAVTIEAVTRLEWLGLARTLRVVAVVVEARLA